MSDIIPATDSEDVARWAIAYQIVVGNLPGAKGRFENPEQAKQIAGLVREVYEELSANSTQFRQARSYQG